MRRITLLFTMGVSLLALPGCSNFKQWVGGPSEGLLPPVVNPITQMNQSLRDLPAPRAKIAVAVYGFTDQTGQMKASTTLQTLSRAVTQGGPSILMKALQDAGQGRWFTVIERERIDTLLRERSIIQQTRQMYLGEKGVNTSALPPLLFAGILLDGGIIAYDSNTRTGGAGASLLGITADGTYQEDMVTVSLRAISTKTGEVLSTVTVHKTIISVGLQGNSYKYIASDKILQAEAGFTTNEPGQLAVQQAIEKAVRTLIVDGADRRLWSFADAAAGDRLIADYRREQFGEERHASWETATEGGEGESLK
jgi:curli production assembly/transport component CsgG